MSELFITWNELHFQCMCLHFGIHHFGMDPIRIGNFYPCNLCKKRRKKIINPLWMRVAVFAGDQNKITRQPYHCEFILKILQSHWSQKLIKPNIKYNGVVAISGVQMNEIHYYCWFIGWAARRWHGSPKLKPHKCNELENISFNTPKSGKSDGGDDGIAFEVKLNWLEFWTRAIIRIEDIPMVYIFGVFSRNRASRRQYILLFIYKLINITEISRFNRKVKSYLVVAAATMTTSMLAFQMPNTNANFIVASHSPFPRRIDGGFFTVQ